MPKSQLIDPFEIRKPGLIEFGKIPVNQYNKTIEQEKKVFSKDDFLKIYRDMVIIREFETMLNVVKIKGEFDGVKYDHPGACTFIYWTGGFRCWNGLSFGYK